MTRKQTLDALIRFIEHEATAGLFLTLAALAAIVLTNAGLADEYDWFLHQRVQVGVGALVLDKSLQHFINDGLMALFFFLVGLEIKREVLEGELSTPAQVMLPAGAALGGVVVPSLIYVFFAGGDAETIKGWAIPSATDIAFALGALALAGKRVPLSLKVFLLTLATFDDFAAIIIIAAFYTANLSLVSLALSLAVLALVILFNRFKVDRTALYMMAGFVMWVLVLKSGVHATLAGVALAFTIPLHRRDGSHFLHALEEGLHPYVKFFILPLFAFANAGIPLDGFSLAALSQPVPLGIAAGLVLGKPIGILGVSAVLILSRIARLPEGANWAQLAGTSCLAGIGFTMSLFIGSLAFDSVDMNNAVRAGVIAGSLISTIIGMAILALASKGRMSG
jgi:NhaA family Na+:H+ antiporter